MLKRYTMNDDIEKKERAVALGYFDGVHAGHVAVIKAAIDSGRSPAVFSFTTSRERPEKKKNSGYIMTLEQKLIEFEKLGVETVFMPDFSDIKDFSAEQFVYDILKKKLSAEVVCCGDNFRFGKGAACGVDELGALCRKNGMELKIVDSVIYNGDIVSSTRIRDCIMRGDITSANAMLTRPFSYDYPVSFGARLGHTIGYPTMNQHFDEGFVIARYGVYATVALIGDEEYPAITNIGIKPTVGGTTPVSETHVFGSLPDMYGKRVEIKVLGFIREERKFRSLAELKGQIDSDVAVAKRIYADYVGQN